MRYRNFGRSSLKVSELCLGTMTFGWSVDEEDSHSIISHALDNGINFLDTADVYSRWSRNSYAGKSEEIIGRWLAANPGRRQQIILATKVRSEMSDDPNDVGLSRRHILQAVEGSLRRLQTDYIDLYQTHWPDDATEIEETLRALDDLVHSGKVRYIGCSNYAAWQLMEALWHSDQGNLARFFSLQPHFNLFHRSEFERELQPVCLKYNIGVIPYSPLAGGLLTGKYRRNQPMPLGTRFAEREDAQKYLTERLYAIIDVLQKIAFERQSSIPQIAVAWVKNAPAITSAIIGATSLKQLEDTIAGADIDLTPEERHQLDRISDWREA